MIISYQHKKETKKAANNKENHNTFLKVIGCLSVPVQSLIEFLTIDYSLILIASSKT